MYQYKFRIPPYYTLLVRSLTILEGIALASDPNYKVLGAAYPWVARRILTDKSPELRAALRNLLYSSDGMFRFERMESLLEQAMKSPPPPKPPKPQPSTSSDDRRFENIQPGGSRNSTLSLLLSSDGEFLRGIILDEISKGLDAATRLQMDSTSNRIKHALAQVTGGSNGTAGFGGAPWTVADAASSMHEQLSKLPQLADTKDTEQVEGILRLATQLQSLAEKRTEDSVNGSGNNSKGDDQQATSLSILQSLPSFVSIPGASQQLESVQSASRIVSWIVSELGELSEEERRAVVSIPGELASRVSSRVAARAVRLLATGQSTEGSSIASSS